MVAVPNPGLLPGTRVGTYLCCSGILHSAQSLAMQRPIRIGRSESDKDLAEVRRFAFPVPELPAAFAASLRDRVKWRATEIVDLEDVFLRCNTGIFADFWRSVPLFGSRRCRTFVRKTCRYTDVPIFFQETERPCRSGVLSFFRHAATGTAVAPIRVRLGGWAIVVGIFCHAACTFPRRLRVQGSYRNGVKLCFG